jgi:hypothetical protein
VPVLLMSSQSIAISAEGQASFCRGFQNDMSINWQDVITALGGNAVLLAAMAWLIQKLVSNRLTMAAEEFKIEIKAKADIEIETTSTPSI